jgi:tetratricopeptide (TPR) repeat protein
MVVLPVLIIGSAALAASVKPQGMAWDKQSTGVEPAKPAVPLEQEPANLNPASTLQQQEQTQPEPASEKPKKPEAQPDEFPPNPLEITTPDPLLPPRIPVDRPLSPLERKSLEAALDQLNTEATAQLKIGNTVNAFEIWDRELRLRRVLGPLPEAQALARVGEVAWKENQPYQVQIITGRLQAIQQAAEAKSPVDLTLLEALGQAYEQVRSPGLAVNIYDKLLADARQRKNPARIEAILLKMAQLHMSWFDYPKAAIAYQELVAVAQATNNRVNEIKYLNELAYVYEQGKQPEQAIAIQQQLLTLHQKAREPEPIPLLKLKIADNYMKIQRPDLAERNYQEAFTLAQPLSQFAYASDALQKLAALYKSVDRLDAALKIYGYLVVVEQQAYNYFGIMSAYDEIGNIHLKRKNYPQAITAYQQGLNLARQLKYREDHFKSQIKKVQQAAQPPKAPPPPGASHAAPSRSE